MEKRKYFGIQLHAGVTRNGEIYCSSQGFPVLSSENGRQNFIKTLARDLQPSVCPCHAGSPSITVCPALLSMLGSANLRMESLIYVVETGYKVAIFPRGK